MDTAQLQTALAAIWKEARNLPPEANAARLELEAALDQQPPDPMRLARALRSLAEHLLEVDRADLAQKLNGLPGQ